MDSYNTYQCQDSVLFEIALVTSNISNAIESSWFLKASLRLGKIRTPFQPQTHYFINANPDYVEKIVRKVFSTSSWPYPLGNDYLTISIRQPRRQFNTY